jgi:hypothetical protein
MIHEYMPYVEREDGYKYRMSPNDTKNKAFWHKLGVK